MKMKFYLWSLVVVIDSFCKQHIAIGIFPFHLLFTFYSPIHCKFLFAGVNLFTGSKQCECTKVYSKWKLCGV